VNHDPKQQRVMAGFGGQVVLGDPKFNVSFSSTCTDFTPGLESSMQRAVLPALYASP
jgi:hypothetical protein